MTDPDPPTLTLEELAGIAWQACCEPYRAPYVVPSVIATDEAGEWREDFVCEPGEQLRHLVERVEAPDATRLVFVQATSSQIAPEGHQVLGVSGPATVKAVTAVDKAGNAASIWGTDNQPPFVHTGLHYGEVYASLVAKLNRDFDPAAEFAKLLGPPDVGTDQAP